MITLGTNGLTQTITKSSLWDTPYDALKCTYISGTCRYRLFEFVFSGIAKYSKKSNIFEFPSSFSGIALHRDHFHFKVIQISEGGVFVLNCFHTGQQNDSL